MSRSSKRLINISIFYLISSAIGTALAVQENLPSEFGGLLQGKNVLNDFISGLGTAFSPPLIVLAVQVLFMVLITRQDALKRIGAGGLMVLGALYFFGQLGEPALWRNLTPGGFHLEQALVIAANLILPILMFFAGVLVLRRLIRPDGISPH